MRRKYFDKFHTKHTRFVTLVSLLDTMKRRKSTDGPNAIQLKNFVHHMLLLRIAPNVFSNISKNTFIYSICNDYSNLHSPRYFWHLTNSLFKNVISSSFSVFIVLMVLLLSLHLIELNSSLRLLLRTPLLTI